MTRCARCLGFPQDPQRLLGVEVVSFGLPVGPHDRHFSLHRVGELLGAREEELCTSGGRGLFAVVPCGGGDVGGILLAHLDQGDLDRAGDEASG